MRRSVRSRLVYRVDAPAAIELQVAIAGHYRPDEEELVVTIDGNPVAVTETLTEAGTRVHLGEVGAGLLEARYRADGIALADPLPVHPLDVSVYRRPSRYAESDRLHDFAVAEFGHLNDPAELVRAIPAWVGTRLSYVPGSSTGTDSATTTLLARKGVCRDYAHLTCSLLRARDVPARIVSVYAPGLDPMDFHAVVEAVVDGRWCVVDATLLAPRSSLVRIATGRDAADTSFLTNHGGQVTMQMIDIAAVVDDELPGDDPRELEQIR